MVVQFGLAMMPFGGRSGVVGVDLGRRPAAPRDPSARPRSCRSRSRRRRRPAGAVASEAVLPLENRARSSPVKSAVSVSSTTISVPAQGSVRARRPGRGEEPDVGDGEGTLRQQRAHHAADLAGGSENSYAHGGHPRARLECGLDLSSDWNSAERPFVRQAHDWRRDQPRTAPDRTTSGQLHRPAADCTIAAGRRGPDRAGASRWASRRSTRCCGSSSGSPVSVAAEPADLDPEPVRGARTGRGST